MTTGDSVKDTVLNSIRTLSRSYQVHGSKPLTPNATVAEVWTV